MYRKFQILFFCFLVSNTCFAHGFGGNGFLHPLTGIDHLLAMLAVGVWSAQIGGKAIYIVPSCFLMMMVIGGIVGLKNISFVNVELMIAVSVLLLGLAISLNRKNSILVAGIGVAVFGFCHGFAHGSEVPKSLSAFEYIVGFLITTFGLHMIGAVSGLLILEEKNGATILRIIGIAISFVGTFLILS